MANFEEFKFNDGKQNSFKQNEPDSFGDRTKLFRENLAEMQAKHALQAKRDALSTDHDATQIGGVLGIIGAAGKNANTINAENQSWQAPLKADAIASLRKYSTDVINSEDFDKTRQEMQRLSAQYPHAVRNENGALSNAFLGLTDQKLNTSWDAKVDALRAVHEGIGDIEKSISISLARREMADNLEVKARGSGLTFSEEVRVNLKSLAKEQSAAESSLIRGVVSPAVKSAGALIVGSLANNFADDYLFADRAPTSTTQLTDLSLGVTSMFVKNPYVAASLITGGHMLARSVETTLENYYGNK